MGKLRIGSPAVYSLLLLLLLLHTALATAVAHTVHFALPVLNVPPFQSLIQITVQATPALSGSSALSVSYYAKDGTALANTDYALSAGTLNLSAGQDAIPLEVFHLPERGQNLSFWVVLTDLQSTIAADALGSQSSIQVFIINNSPGRASPSIVTILTWVGLSLSAIGIFGIAGFTIWTIQKRLLEKKLMNSAVAFPEPSRTVTQTLSSTASSKPSNPSMPILGAPVTINNIPTASPAVEPKTTLKPKTKNLFLKPRVSIDKEAEVSPAVPAAPEYPNLPPISALTLEDNDLSAGSPGTSPQSPVRKGSRSNPVAIQNGAVDVDKTAPKQVLRVVSGGKMEFGVKIATQQFAKPRQFKVSTSSHNISKPPSVEDFEIDLDSKSETD